MPASSIWKPSTPKLCLFCAFRAGQAPRLSHGHMPFQKRAYRASTLAGQPPGVAHALAEDVPFDDPPQPSQHHVPPPSKSSSAAWPTFVPRKPPQRSLPPQARSSETGTPESRPPNPRPQHESQSWKCLGCRTINLPKREHCLHCHQPRFGRPALRSVPSTRKGEAKWDSPTERAGSVRETSMHWKPSIDDSVPTSKVNDPFPSSDINSSTSTKGTNESVPNSGGIFFKQRRFGSELDQRNGRRSDVMSMKADRPHFSFVRGGPVSDSHHPYPDTKAGSGSGSAEPIFRKMYRRDEPSKPLSPDRAPWGSAQHTLRPMERPISLERNQDSGDRSGMAALLEHTAESRRDSLQSPATATRKDARDRSADRRAYLDQPHANPAPPDTTPSNLRTPNFADSLDWARPISQENGDTQETQRIRGRFQRDLQEPESGQRNPGRRSERGPGRKARYRDVDEEFLLESVGSNTRQRSRKNTVKDKGSDTAPARTPIQLPDFITVENLARAMHVRVEVFVSRIEEMGFDTPRHDHILDAETSGLIAGEFDFEPTFTRDSSVEDLVAQPAPDNGSILPARPPIVTIMGHVDHGKTTILDWLRKSSVVESEHGGITQHIGAFSVTMPGGKQITFLDTPGHAAFLDMRRRGANVTDIVVLVVAADDGVKPQTLEAIKHATDAKVPIIVAINKVDKPGGDADRVKQDLARHGVTVEDFGGEVQAIPVSGKMGTGMAELEEATLTLSELLDHRAERDGLVEGWILESKVTMAGRVATVLVRRGTMRQGDIIVAGTAWARIRNLRNDAGISVDEALPGTPVQIDGWRADDPIAGWEVLEANDEEHAKSVVELRHERNELIRLADDSVAINAARAEQAEERHKVLLDWEVRKQTMTRRRKYRPHDNAGWVDGKPSGGPRQVHFVVKADVSGSVEAVVNSVSAIGNNEIVANVIRSGVGSINESDVDFLASSGEVGFLISFNQSVDGQMYRLAEEAGVEILDHNIIYKVTDVVKEKLTAELPVNVTQRVVGEADIDEIFEIGVKKTKLKVAGCKIGNGIISRDKKVRVLEAGKVVYDGKVESLKNIKKDVKEMRKGSECGMAFEGWGGFRKGHQVQCYEEEEIKRTL